MKYSSNTIRDRLARRTAGMTMIETVVGVAVGSLTLMSVMSVFSTSNRSLVAQGNYASLEQASSLAVEQMRRDIGNSEDLTSFSTNQLVFIYSGTTNLVYTYDPSAATLTSWKTGGTTNTLLTGCDFLQFSMYANVTQPGGTLPNATTVAKAKAISTTWRCSRTILGSEDNTEYMQESLILIRNKLVH